MGEVELKTCPFCGKKLYQSCFFFGRYKVYQHFGDDGCFLGDFEISGKDEIERWNNRVEEAKNE